MISRTVIRGFKEEYGSWKMIFSFFLASRSAFPFKLVKSSPCRITFPEVGSVKRIIDFTVVDLPHPLSPTIANVSLRCSTKLTSSTAFTLSFF